MVSAVKKVRVATASSGRLRPAGKWSCRTFSPKEPLSRLFGGATSVVGFGGWLDDERGGNVKEEQVSLVMSFTTADELNADNVLELRRFLHRMGREAQQGEVACYSGGRLMRIRSYDKT